MLFTNGRISVRQMQALIILWIFSSALIGMPSASVYNIYSVIIGAAIVLAECIFICIAEKRLRSSNVIYKAVYILSGISMIVYSGINIRLLSEAIGLYILSDTPMWIVSAVFVLAALYSALLGKQTLGSTSEIMFLIVAVNAAITTVLCMIDAGGGLLSAAFAQPSENIILNGIKCSCMFGGVQSLFFILPHTDGADRNKKAVYAVIIAEIAVIVFTYISVSKFGLTDTSLRMFPALNIMDTVNLQFIFGDKQDVFMLRMWIFAVFIAVSFGVYAFGNAISFEKNSSIQTILGALAALAVSFVPVNTTETVQLLYTVGEASLIIFGIAVPLISFIFAGKGAEL